MPKNNKNKDDSYFLVCIVAIVAIVAIVIMVLSSSGTHTNKTPTIQKENVAGKAMLGLAEGTNNISAFFKRIFNNLNFVHLDRNTDKVISQID